MKTKKMVAVVAVAAVVALALASCAPVVQRFAPLTTKVVRSIEVVPYNFDAGRNWETVWKGLAPEYMELAKIYRKALIGKLEEEGFVVLGEGAPVTPSDGGLELRIKLGIGPKSIPFIRPTSGMGLDIEAWERGKLLLHFETALLTSPLFPPTMALHRNRLVRRAVDKLKREVEVSVSH